MFRLFLAFSLCFLSHIYFVTATTAAERIVFINPGARGEDFWENVTSAMQAAADQLGFELEVHWAGRNKLNMRNLGIEVAEGGGKPAFMVLVNEERAASPILVATEKAGIKTIFLSNGLSHEEINSFEKQYGKLKHMLGSVVPDMRPAGARMAKAMVEEAQRRGLQSTDGKLHVVAIGGDETSSTSIQRNAGFLNYIQSRNDVTLERFLFANWNENEAQQLMQRLLELMQRQGNRLSGVWAANDPMAIGAVKAIENAGLKPGTDTMVVGLNWSLAAIRRIRDGEMLLSDGGHFLAGAWLIVALADYRKGCMIAGGRNLHQLEVPTSVLDGLTDPALLTLLEKQDYRSIDFSRFLSQNQQCGEYDFSTTNLVRSLRYEQANDN